MQLDADDSVRRIRSFILRELLRDEDLPLAAEESLFGSGLLDSFAVTRLIVFIEDEFGVRLPVGRMSIQDFDSLELCAGVVESVRGDQAR
jgi:acyl carrier protein